MDSSGQHGTRLGGGEGINGGGPCQAPGQETWSGRAGSRDGGRLPGLIFETWDRLSADIVVGLPESNDVTRLVRETADATHFRIGPPGFWRVYVRAFEEAQGQESLDAEIGREAEELE